MLNRVVVYIDGFNLYYGLKQKGWSRYYWLDIRRMSMNLLRQNQKLEKVRYFTAKVHRVSNDTNKTERQNTYLNALKSLDDVKIHYGYYHLNKSRRCPFCKAKLNTYKEKMTDINIAVNLLNDAQSDLFDTAILVSGDSDLSGAVKSIHTNYDNKRVVVFFPPSRRSKKLQMASFYHLSINRSIIQKSQLPNPFVAKDGKPWYRPEEWGK